MKILQVVDEETGALMATVPINELQFKMIQALAGGPLSQGAFKGVPTDGPLAEAEAWRALGRWSLDQAWALEAEISKKYGALFGARPLPQAHF